MSLAIVDVLVIAVRAIIEDLGMVVVGPKSHASECLQSPTSFQTWCRCKHVLSLVVNIPPDAAAVAGNYGACLCLCEDTVGLLDVEYCPHVDEQFSVRILLTLENTHVSQLVLAEVMYE